MEGASKAGVKKQNKFSIGQQMYILAQKEI